MSRTSRSATRPRCDGAPADKWVFSEQIAHPPIIGTEDFELAQATLVR